MKWMPQTWLHFSRPHSERRWIWSCQLASNFISQPPIRSRALATILKLPRNSSENTFFPFVKMKHILFWINSGLDWLGNIPESVWKLFSAEEASCRVFYRKIRFSDCWTWSFVKKLSVRQKLELLIKSFEISMEGVFIWAVCTIQVFGKHEFPLSSSFVLENGFFQTPSELI